eukprot:4352281-Amphidinium_carterae.1
MVDWMSVIDHVESTLALNIAQSSATTKIRISPRYGVITIPGKDPARRILLREGAPPASRRRMSSSVPGLIADGMDAIIVMPEDQAHHNDKIFQQYGFPHNAVRRSDSGSSHDSVCQTLCPIDTEYDRIRTNVSEVAMVSRGTSAFTHVDVGEFNAESRRGRAYPPPVETINPTPQFEDMTLMRELEPPMEAQPNPLLIWERRDGGSTTSEEPSESDTRAPAPGDTRGYGPPTPPPEESDGEVPEHERTQEDHMRLLEGRLISNAYEIDRRESIIRKNQGVERRLEERRRVAKALNQPEDGLMTRVVADAIDNPAVLDALPKPSPPQPPPPKQPPDNLAREMEQAMASVRAKNAA